MKKTHLLLTGALALGAISAANAATAVTNYGGTPFGTETDLLTGAEGAQTRSREVIYSATQKFVIGQNFKLAAGSSYDIDSIYIKSASGEDWDKYSANLEIKVFSGTGGTATLLGTGAFDLNAAGDNTAASDILANQWAKFQFDTGITVTGGADLSFLMFFGGEDADHKWAFRRDDSGIYADGNQWEDTTYAPTDWGTAPWTGVGADNNDDLMFYVAGVAVPEPSSTALLGLAGLAFMIRRRR